jgi:tetratricopeptide (TPR) repeat protein
MREDHDLPVTADSLSLSELLARYVSSQVGRFRAGADAPDLGSEVLPHDAAALQAADPRLAWDEAVAALAPGSRPAAGSLPAPSAVPDWRNLVAAQEPALDLAFCVGNFPQMVRNLSLLLQAGEARQAGARPFPSEALLAWADQAAKGPWPMPLLAVGVLRLAREFTRAAELLPQCAASAPAEGKAALANEEAALAWHAGRRQEALDLWHRGDKGHVPTLFNVGMAALFSGKPAEARAPLAQAVAKLPEDNSWHHLARLYLTLAEMRAA